VRSRAGIRFRFNWRNALLTIAGVIFGVLAYLYLSLPDVRRLRVENPTTTAFMDLRARERIGRGQRPRKLHRWLRNDRMSPHIRRAVLVAEDSAFWQHEGVDFDQIRESLLINYEKGRFARGASTITQQLARNVYLSPARNPVRKLREVLIARRLEVELSKERILELYLNVIEWGDGVYGVEAASHHYFGHGAASLSPEESALLAASIINPRALNPARPSARLRRRQQLILNRMGQRSLSTTVGRRALAIAREGANHGQLTAYRAPLTLTAPETVPILNSPPLEKPILHILTHAGRGHRAGRAI